MRYSPVQADQKKPNWAATRPIWQHWLEEELIVLPFEPRRLVSYIKTAFIVWISWKNYRIWKMSLLFLIKVTIYKTKFPVKFHSCSG